MEGLAELDQLGQAGVAEPADSLEEAAGEAAALGAGLVLVQQQVAEAPPEAVDDLRGGMLGQLLVEALLLGRAEAVAAHEAQQAAVAAGGGTELAPAGEEVMVDEADDVEAAGHDAGVGEALAHQGALEGGQIDADQFDLLLALQALETGVEAGLRAAGHDVEDPVRARVAQRGGVAEAAREEALVQAEVFRTADRLPLGRLAAESVLEVALDGGRASPAAASEIPCSTSTPKIGLSDCESQVLRARRCCLGE
ncbi:MAG: hypothetical protein KatS3mg005_0878 [Bryobacteraceae bacterium]|nr:MAG: hypothetical protein KatS3mg005_0878 [Bryobacteraceae bacterium]